MVIESTSREYAIKYDHTRGSLAWRYYHEPYQKQMDAWWTYPREEFVRWLKVDVKTGAAIFT